MAESGSFAKAAKATGLTRSALGKAVARLEARLGARLLHRTTRQVAVTATGAAFRDRCLQILDELAEAEAEARKDRIEPGGTLRLTLPDAFGRLRVLPVLQKYLHDWPNLEADVSFSDRIVDIVQDGYDLAVRIGALPSDSRLVARVIHRSRAILCASPDYIAEHGGPASVSDLPQHQRLVFGNGAEVHSWRFTSPEGVATELRERGRLRFDSGEALRDAVVSGLGIAYLPRFLVEGDVKAGRLQVLLADWLTEEIPVYAVYSSRRHLPAKVRLLLDQLSERLA